MKNIPNYFTLLNLFFGSLACIFIMQNGIIISGSPDGSTWIDIPEKIWMASLFIGLAAVVDFLDGFVARLIGAESEMGKQLDSLADVVSFGVAPGLIMYHFLRLSIAKDSNALDTSIMYLLPALLIPCAAAWRLARFNIDTEQSFSFKGLPAPANGLFFASFPLIYWNENAAWIQELILNKWFLYGVILIMVWLMVSKLPLLSLKFKSKDLKSNLPKILLVVVSVVLIFLLKWIAAPAILLLYVLVSLLNKNKAA